MFSAAAFEFLRGLAANNEKAWFEAHREEYERAVRTPAAELVAAVATELSARGLPLEGEPKRSMFRLNRDVRFSHNKDPYKTAVGIVWYRQGGSKKSPGVLYFHLEPGACFVGAAFYHPEPEVLDSIRERIRVRPEQFAALEAALAAEKLELVDTGRLARMPKGFEDLKGSAIDPALRLKDFLVRRPLTEKQVQNKGLVDRIVDLAADALPLLRFGWDAVDEVAAAMKVSA